MDQKFEYIRLDYNLQTPEERTELAKRIVEETPSELLTNKYLEKIADYIIFAMDKQEKKQKTFLTDNHMITVNNRETSFEGLVGKLENGEDGIYSMIAEDKNIIFRPKVEITKKDIAEIPYLAELRATIAKLEEQFKNASGYRKAALKQSIIQLRKDQYTIKNAYRKPIFCLKTVKSMPKLDLSEKVYIDDSGDVKSTGFINLYNPAHISLLLCNYSKIKEDTYSNFNSDCYWLMQDLEDIIDNYIKEQYPLYFDVIVYKIDKKTNEEIQGLLYADYGVLHTPEYLSALWRKKIPKLIAEKAQEDWLIWHYTYEEEGKWKKCSKCGQIKLANNRFFSKNNTSKDGYYSICKECRNNKKKVK